jgi:2-polyprenyl-3-methyl-5-hydroxy-6-metoxy-1,4-benzoquinol methylase
MSGERQVGPTLAHVEEWHRWRYIQTLEHVSGKDVLDVGCGIGYGSFIMSCAARSVMGIDDSAETIKFAEKEYGHRRMIFDAQDFLGFFAKHFDVVVAFEVIEHIEDTDKVFKKIEACTPDKVIVSTPHLRCPIGGNQFHYRHYGMDELIERFFQIGYKPERAELKYFGNGLCNFIIVKKE